MLFEFLRNNALDAQIYDFTGTRPKGTPTSPFKWNQYGFTLGGPVWLPKKMFGPLGYENRERIFFMTNFEGFRERRTLLISDVEQEPAVPRALPTTRSQLAPPIRAFLILEIAKGPHVPQDTGKVILAADGQKGFGICGIERDAKLV